MLLILYSLYFLVYIGHHNPANLAARSVNSNAYVRMCLMIF